jgi:hypothetical protein
MKRLLSIALAALMLLALLATGAAATSQPPTLTVAMKYGNTPLGGIHVAVCRVADLKEKAYVSTQAFAGAGADFTNLTKEKNIALAASLNAYAIANDVPRSVKVTDSGGKAVYAALAPGLYLVAQVDGENSEYIIAPYLVAVREDVTASPKSEPIKRSTESVSVSVTKIWKGAGGHPGSVQVQLYRDGKPHGAPVTLSGDNHWTHTWADLSAADPWTVDEINVPAGYAKAVSGSVSSGFFITNTKQEPPSTPGEPTSPPSPAVPKTEDTSNMLLWVTLIACSFFGLIAVFFFALKTRRVARVRARGSGGNA